MADNKTPITEQVALQMHHDRILLNNPLIMQGMGIAPLIVVATTVDNALMLLLAVALLLTPTRVFAALLLRNVTSWFARALGYTVLASFMYIGTYFVMERVFGVAMLHLGIYLPLLVVDPLVIYRFSRVPEPVHKAVLKGLRITIGYGIVLLLVGSAREFLVLGSIKGAVLIPYSLLPILATPAGAFLLLGALVAVWRQLVYHRRDTLVKEARRER